MGRNAFQPLDLLEIYRVEKFTYQKKEIYRVEKV